MNLISDVWDVDAGYLSSQQLGEFLQYLGSLLGQAGAPARANLPARWRGHRDALTVRYNQVLAEMGLRQLPAPNPLPLPDEAILWPVSFTESPNAQLAQIRQLNEQGQRGRIAAAASEHELWAQYKYSVMARNQEAYRHFGQVVAARSISRDELVLELVNSARMVPTLGGLRNAVYHMWGYISAFSTRKPDQCDLATLMREVQQLAMAHNVTYLVHSTALGELAYWCQCYAGQEAAKVAKPGGR